MDPEQNQDKNVTNQPVGEMPTDNGGVVTDGTNAEAEPVAGGVATDNVTAGGAMGSIATETMATEVVSESMMPGMGMAAGAEPTFSNGASDVIMANESNGASGKKTKNLGMKIAIAVLAVAAAGGIGFGAWAMISGQQEVKALNNQIATLKQANSNLVDKVDEERPEIENVENVEEAPAPAPAPAVDTSEYIYIGEFGIKIKKPENWLEEMRNYAYYNDYPQAVPSFIIEESGDSSVARNVMIAEVSGEICDSLVASSNNACVKVGDKNLNVSIAESVTDEFRDNFMNPDNYSAI